MLTFENSYMSLGELYLILSGNIFTFSSSNLLFAISFSIKIEMGSKIGNEMNVIRHKMIFKNWEQKTT